MNPELKPSKRLIIASGLLAVPLFVLANAACGTEENDAKYTINKPAPEANAEAIKTDFALVPVVDVYQTTSHLWKLNSMDYDPDRSFGLGFAQEKNGDIDILLDREHIKLSENQAWRAYIIGKPEQTFAIHKISSFPASEKIDESDLAPEDAVREYLAITIGSNSGIDKNMNGMEILLELGEVKEGKFVVDDSSRMVLRIHTR